MPRRHHRAGEIGAGLALRTPSGALRPGLRALAAPAGVLAWAVLWPILALASVVARVLLIVLLHLTRPLIVWPLLLGTAAGMGAALCFLAAGQWHDAGKAAVATATTAALLGLHSRLAQWLDPDHHGGVPLRHRRF